MAAVTDGLNSDSNLQDIPPLETSRTVQNQGIEALKDIAYGSTAGILGKFIEYPFDTIKVRLQSQSHSPTGARLNGPLSAFLAALHSPEGPVKSLYRGISAPLVGAAVETSCLFFSYRIAQDAIIASSPTLRFQKESSNSKIQLPFAYLVLCGAASGAFTSLALTPIELVKCKMQVPMSNGASAANRTHSKLPGPTRIILDVFRTQGLLGFWHGQLGTLIRETGGSAAWFGSYEGVKMLYLKYDKSVDQIEDVKVWQQMTAGAVAGMAYNFIFYPADTIKSRMQTEELGVTKSKGTFLGTGRELWHHSGLRGFYRGCGITVFRAAPSSAIIFSIYEGLRKHLG